MVFGDQETCSLKIDCVIDENFMAIKMLKISESNEVISMKKPFQNPRTIPYKSKQPKTMSITCIMKKTSGKIVTLVEKPKATAYLCRLNFTEAIWLLFNIKQ